MKNQRLYWIDPTSPPTSFPGIESALREPDGLLAVGGDLNSERLLCAYERGIFPWYVEGQPILWWSPDPRCVLIPERFHVSRRLARDIRRSALSVTANTAFEAVIRACAEPREHQDGTWITADMLDAYCRLHDEGWAHSVEVWLGDRLVGGIYGVAIDRVFFGESMFSRETNASKIAFYAVCRWGLERGIRLVDCQVESPHLLTLGARTMPRNEFAMRLRELCTSRTPLGGLPVEPVAANNLL
ncbi:MAG: leucyl/phenylalanyl-tRNA--protein transferase [Woeseiaceae bacterium]|nr:leucyl/phenylalanyl-tRNA--protein transferase [Woeseiaceae bacterium]